MQTLRHWTLGAKLSLVATPFLLIGLLAIGVLVWMSLQLEGGAASVNEAGRMRMQAYRMVLSVGAADQEALTKQVSEFDRSLALLRDGDPERPLFVPWDDTVRQRFATVEQDWLRFRGRVAAPQPAAAAAALGREAAAFAGVSQPNCLRISVTCVSPIFERIAIFIPDARTCCAQARTGSFKDIHIRASSNRSWSSCADVSVMPESRAN